jgi:anti-sigma-K factor RskA
MSPSNENHDRRCGTDVAAYALGALQPTEAQAFSRHLHGCSVCAQELASFRQIVDQLPLAAPRYQPRPALRRHVLAVVASEARAHHAAQPSRRARRARRLPALSLPGVPSRAIAIASAVVALVLIAAVTLVLTSRSGSSERTIAAQVTGPGRATLRVADGRGELIVHGLPAAPHGDIYEVWLQRNHQAVPTRALFNVTAHGDGDIDVPGSLHGISGVMVTPEPLGGSRVPTHAPVIIATLA